MLGDGAWLHGSRARPPCWARTATTQPHCHPISHQARHAARAQRVGALCPGSGTPGQPGHLAGRAPLCTLARAKRAHTAGPCCTTRHTPSTPSRAQRPTWAPWPHSLKFALNRCLAQYKIAPNTQFSEMSGARPAAPRWGAGPYSAPRQAKPGRVAAQGPRLHDGAQHGHLAPSHAPLRSRGPAPPHCPGPSRQVPHQR